MLHIYERFAVRLFPFRAVFWCIAAAALAAFVTLLFFAPGAGDTGWMFLALVVLLWAICGLLLIHAFIHPAPVVQADAPFGRRLLTRLARVGRWALAVTLAVLGVLVVVLTARTVGVLSRTLGG